MNIEVLISTMYRNSMDIFAGMNIRSDALAVNQYDHGFKEECVNNNRNVHRMISLNERGLSKSRNLALRNSNADVCVIADDDLVYRDDYTNVITDAYEKHPDADIIAFSVPSSNTEWPTNVLKHPNVGALQSMKLCSVQLTFRRQAIMDRKIGFNELFGAGSVYSCGEENIFLVECLKKGLKIIYIDREIATVNQDGSTWFKGYDRSFFKTKGAMFYEMSRALWFPLILQFAVRKRKLYQSRLSMPAALKYMFIGGLEYKSILRKGKNGNERNRIDTKDHTLFLVREKAEE